MAFYMPMPFTSENSFDPARLADAPLVQDFTQDAPVTYFDCSTFFDYDSFGQDTLVQDQFCADTYQAVNGPAPDVYLPAPAFCPPSDLYSVPSSTSMSHIEQPSVSPYIAPEALAAWFVSQIEDTGASVTPAHAVSSPTSATSYSQQRHIGRIPHDEPMRSAQSAKRKPHDSDYEDDSGASSDCSEYAPHRPAKRPATTRRAMYNPLPESLQPIRVHSAALPRCPMPGCGVELDAKDSAWRGHFKRAHHDALCLTPDCRGLVSGSCKARCPLPISGCKSCGSADEHKHGHVPRKGTEGAMTIESVGRHLLNVHIKVAYRCPLCGLQNEWRESACVRHIRRCAEKYGKKPKGRSSC